MDALQRVPAQKKDYEIRGELRSALVATQHLHHHHQQHTRAQDAHCSPYPRKGALHYYEKNDSNKNYCWYFIHHAHANGRVTERMFSNAFEHALSVELIYKQTGHEGEFNVHPRLCQECRVEHEQPNAKDEREDARGPGNRIPQAALHDRVLFHENATAWFFRASCFSVIDEESEHVKQSCKPRHDKDDVQRFNDGVVFHEFKSNASMGLGFLACSVNFLDD